MPTAIVPLRIVSAPSVGPMVFSLTGFSRSSADERTAAENLHEPIDALAVELPGDLAAGW